MDFSKVTRLRKVKIWLGNLDDVPIAMALKTITSDHRDLQKISLLIRVSSLPNEPVGEETRRLWAEFDNILIRLWESKTIKIYAQVVCPMCVDHEAVWKLVRSLLTGTLERGAIELICRLYQYYH